MIFEICFVVAIFSASSSASVNCPNGWTASTTLNKCYKLFTQRIQWYDAEIFCTTQGPEGHLVSIHSRFENNAIRGIAGNTSGSEEGEAWYWIGLNNLRTNDYSWIDGTPVDFTAWAPGQPSSTDIEYCGCMEDMYGPFPACWHTQGCFSCQAERFFLCEIKGM